MGHVVIVFVYFLGIITLLIPEISTGAIFISSDVTVSTSDNSGKSVTQKTILAENKAYSQMQARQKASKKGASKDIWGEYKPSQPWSTIAGKTETRGFIFRKDGTLVYRETVFSPKILLGDDPSKPKYVVPEKILLSPSSPSGRFFFITTKHPAEEQFVCLIDVVEKKLLPITGYRHGVTEWVRWSPDEKYAILHEGDVHELHALYRINLRDGRIQGLWPPGSPLEIPDGEKTSPRAAEGDPWKNLIINDDEEAFCYDLDSFGEIIPGNMISGRVIVTCNPYDPDKCPDANIIKKAYQLTLDVELMKPEVVPLGGTVTQGIALQQGNDISTYAGTWVGSYTCRQGVTGLNLELSQESAGKLKGIFHFYPVESNPNVPSGSFYVNGRLRSDGRLVIRAERWIQRPRNFNTVSLEGRMSTDSKKISGRVSTSGCGEFLIIRKND